MRDYLTLKLWLKERLEECSEFLKEYLTQLDIIEKDTAVPVNERILQIKKIRVEIDKVGIEIDKIKREIKLLNKHSLN